MNKRNIGMSLALLVVITNTLAGGKEPLKLTPLHYAAMTSDALLDQRLQENPNFNVNIPTSNGITPLFLSSNRQGQA